MKKSMQNLNTIAQAIYDKKGFNILSLDVRQISSMTDFIIIAEGNIDRHLKAISNSVKNSLKNNGEMPLFVEGEQSGDWIVIDYGEIVVHLLLPEFREKYALEELWRKANIIDLKIKVDKSHQEEVWET